MLRFTFLPIAVAVLLLNAGCSSGQRLLRDGIAGQSELAGPDVVETAAWPAELPADAAQPWERLDTEGRVLPAGRTASCINAQSEFRSGVEREQSSLIGVSENGEAVRLSSGDAGSGEVSWAYWRLTMGGVQPGAVSADVNSLPMSDDSLSEYYLGLSDYASELWLWYGPFSESHVRLNTAAAIAADSNFLSPLGNLFICAVASDGATFDVVGVAANPVEDGDAEAPPIPTGLSVTPIAGGLELSWDDVIAGDLAGYQVYWRDSWFYDQQATGIQRLGWLEGQSRHMLVLNSTAERYIRVSAVDLSGNESHLSEFVVASPLPGPVPALQLTASAPSGMLNTAISLTAVGADAYDWDLDGDGIYEITGDGTGTQQADTGATGMIRPAVRGGVGDGTAVACGSVSLLIAGNARPVANGYAEPSVGPAPLVIDFTGAGTDPDGEIVLYSWDFDGNGSYDWTNATNSNPPPQTYNIPYLRNVKFRVDDDQGAYDVDTVAVLILDPLPDNLPPAAHLSASAESIYPREEITLYATESSDPDGTITDYEWDFDSDGIFNETSNNEDDARGDVSVSLTIDDPGLYSVAVRVTDDDGGKDEASCSFVVHGWVVRTIDSAADVMGECCLQIVAGYPAVSYGDGAAQRLLFAGAEDSYGLTWGEPVIVADLGAGGFFDSLQLVAGHPAIAYWDTTSDVLKYVRADDAFGSSWGTPIPADSTAGTGPYCSLLVVDGKPAVSYMDGSTDLIYVRALDSLGSSWGSPVLVHGGSAGAGYDTSMRIVDGHPAIGYWETSAKDPYYVRSFDVAGVIWGTPVSADPEGGWDTDGRFASLAIVAGRPAISYTRESLGELRFVRAGDSVGGTWETAIVVDAAVGYGQHTSLCVIGGLPAISYLDSVKEDLKFVRAIVPNGALWDLPVTVDAVSDVGYCTSMVEVNGLPAIAYVEATQMDLKYAIGF